LPFTTAFTYLTHACPQDMPMYDPHSMFVFWIHAIGANCRSIPHPSSGASRSPHQCKKTNCSGKVGTYNFGTTLGNLEWISIGKDRDTRFCHPTCRDVSILLDQQPQTYIYIYRYRVLLHTHLSDIGPKLLSLPRN
jgi:hypothetical protein